MFKEDELWFEFRKVFEFMNLQRKTWHRELKLSCDKLISNISLSVSERKISIHQILVYSFLENPLGK
jgi:hypothetical protein